MGNNAVLARHAEPYVAPLRSLVATTHDTATTYGEAAYRSRRWPISWAMTKPSVRSSVSTLLIGSRE
jgi:hypothetical protein